MSSRPRNLVGAIPIALLALALASPMASAQSCVITGIDSLCRDQATELCGPAGNYLYEWTLADGSSSDQRCVMVTEPGTCRLRLSVPGSGTWVECSREVVVGSPGAACLIEGPGTGCEGSTVTLCGPQDAGSWSWTGPGDFFSEQKCIEVTTSGTYFLSIPRSECGGGGVRVCAQDVTFSSCQNIDNCPRPPVFWAAHCRRMYGDSNAQPRVSPAQVAQVAACVDDHVALFNWNRDAAAFCRTMMPSPCNLRTKAKRQFAAVWANVCAAEAGVVPAHGPRVGLDPLALVLIDGDRSTVSAWLATTEARLAALEGVPIKGDRVKSAYREIIRQGWMINHGQGVEPMCSVSRKGSLPRLDDGTAADFEGDETLEAELADESEAPMALTLAGANPFSSSTALAFTLGSSDARDVRIGVYDLAGRLVRELANGRFEPGRHDLQWNGLDQSGARARGGVYFVIGRVGAERVSARLTLVR